jgi:hypothetical protein
MQTTIHISLCGIIIKTTDDAWQKHLEYVSMLHNYFKKEQGRFEIINDIEIRMAELLQEKMNRECSFVNEQDMDNIITRMGTIAAFEELDNDEWEMPGIASEQSNRANSINTSQSAWN